MPIMRPFNPWENGDPFGTSERLESGEGFKLLQWPIKLWKVILQDHLKHCIVEAAQEGDTEAIDELCKAIDRYMK